MATSNNSPSGIREDMRHSRGYGDMFKIAEKAFKSLKTEFIVFDHQELRMICYDYTFSAMENFYEHIGFILFEDWDSEKAQRHYISKKIRLLNFQDIFKITPQDLNYNIFQSEWESILQLVDLSFYNLKRNPIKHTHAGKHDITKQSISSNSPHMSVDERSKLNYGSYHDLTNDECEEFLNNVEACIIKIQSFLLRNQFKLNIFLNKSNDEKSKNRRKQLGVFLTNPFTVTMFSSVLHLNGDEIHITTHKTTGGVAYSASFGKKK